MDAAESKRQDYLEKLDAMAGHAGLRARAWAPMSDGPEALEPMGVARREPQVSRLQGEQAVQQVGQQGPKLVALLERAQKPEQRQPASQALGSAELVEEQQPAWLEQQALRRPVWAQAQRATGHLLEQRQARRKAEQRARARLAAQQAAGAQLLRRRREIVSQRLQRIRRLRRLALAPEWCCELFQQHRPGWNWNESFSPKRRTRAEGQ
jgi:hypothetical protein